MDGDAGSMHTSVALSVGSDEPVIFVQVAPLSVLRNTPSPVAAKRREGVPGVIAIRLNRTPVNVVCASVVQVFPPSVVFSTPLP